MTAFLLTLLALYLLAVALWRFIALPRLSHGLSSDPITNLIHIALKLWARLIHRARFINTHLIPAELSRGLIVVSNHTGSADPLLIQTVCPFEVRWMMATDSMIPQLDFFWKRHKMIPVSRDGRDTGPAREAIRHARSGGCVGIFPEGGIVAPPCEVRPFQSGVGLIVARSSAPVLLVWITGTPATTDMLRSILTPSRARITFVDLIDFAGEKDPEVITESLRHRLSEVSHWPLNDHPLPWQQRREAASPPAVVDSPRP